MKKYIIAIAIALPFILVSCKKDDIKKTESSITEGTWKITMFNDSGTDETYHFSAYNFSFSDDGKATASKSGSTVEGTWSTGTDDSKSKMYLNFGSNDPFEELTDDWHILESTSSKLRLEDVSGGNGGTDLLTFEKN